MRPKKILRTKLFIIMTLLLCAAGFPCMAASDAPSSISSVAISPGSAVVTKNATCTFTATVTGENDYSSEVVWSISGQTSQSTFIDSKGVLNVASDEGATNIVVKAVSRQDSAYSATALAVVQGATYRVNITVNDADGGTATEGKTVNAGENMTLKATPKEGWRFVEWKENDKSVNTNQEFTLENITGDRNLVAVFEKEAPKTYTVTASISSIGGIITPTGSSPVPTGSWIGYAITPDRGYRVRMVYVDGTAIGAATSYNFTDVQGDHTISAEFEPDPAQTDQNQTAQNQADGTTSDKSQNTDQTGDKKTEKTDSDKADKDKSETVKPEQNTSEKTDKEEKEAAAKAEREKMEQERMEKEKAESDRAKRVEQERQRLEQEKADAEKAAAQEKAEKSRQKRIIFGIVAAVVAACALGVFLVIRRRS